MTTLELLEVYVFPLLYINPVLNLILKLKQCILLGYHFCITDYKLLDLTTNETFISKHVIFHEHVFPYKFSLILHSHTSSNSTLIHTLFIPFLCQSLAYESYNAASTILVPNTNLSRHHSHTNSIINL